MDLPMRPDLQEGKKFPDFERPDQDGNRRKLSELLGEMPGVLIFDRGWVSAPGRTNFEIFDRKDYQVGPEELLPEADPPAQRGGGYSRHWQPERHLDGGG